ncbi:unnamed protein product [Blepharisma stoltei]|uniref:Uncharacterized protein n=1 Tax=Blepharisma stoltei TaxID=1481888 RepID=A0AAU9K1R8_9CILI|nr:unnamed protein product [Blepharisma stoltei]
MKPFLKDDDFFLTSTNVKNYPKHPQPLDSNLEDFIKLRQAQTLVESTGFELSHSSLSNSLSQSKLDKIHQKLSSKLSRTLKAKFLKEKSQELLESEPILKHRYEKLKEKVSITSVKGQYNKIPIKPGFSFFDCLIKAPKADITELNQNIPESLYYTDRLYFLFTNPNGKVQCTTDIINYKFMQIVEKYRKDSEDLDIFDHIAAIMRGRDEQIQNMQKFLFDWNQFKVKMIGNETNPGSLMQRYIKVPGGKPSVTRLHYFSHIKGNKANFAYFAKRLDIEEEITESNIQKCAVNMDKPETLEIYKISGPALKPFEKEAKNLVTYLNKGYNLRIQEIILDYLRDSNGVVWLCGCKSIKIDESTLANSLQPVEEWWPNSQKNKPVNSEELEEKKKGLISFVHCKLCRLHYPNNELSHLVSVRMLMLYKVHVTQRMDLPWDTSHLKLTTADLLSQSVRICQFCYLLVTSEFELIKIEEKMAEALHIPKTILGYEEDPALKIQLQFLPKKLVQWRVLLHPIRLFDIKTVKSSNDIRLSLNFAGNITSYPLNWKIEEYYGQKCINLEFTRVHYLFLPEDKNLKEFLASNSLEVVIHIGEFIFAHSKGNIFGEMPINLPIDTAMYQQNQIILFNHSNHPTFNLALIVGFSCDKIISSKKIKVKLAKHQNIYIPVDSFITADPLPKEWMELYGDEKISDHSLYSGQLADEVLYTPHLSKEDLRKMEDIAGSYNSHVKMMRISSAKSFGSLHENSHKKMVIEEKAEKRSIKEIKKKKTKKITSLKLYIPEDILEEKYYREANGIATSKPLNPETREIIEKAPLYPDSKRKIIDQNSNQIVLSTRSSRRSRDSTNYESSGYSLSSTRNSRIARLEKQKFLISQYSGSFSEINNPERQGKPKSSILQPKMSLPLKKEKHDTSKESINLDYVKEIQEGADVDKEIIEGIETIVST